MKKRNTFISGPSIGIISLCLTLIVFFVIYAIGDVLPRRVGPLTIDTPSPTPPAAGTPAPTTTTASLTSLENDATARPAIRDITANLTDFSGGQVQLYEKIELTFAVDTVAKNLQFPYDPAPPPGLEPGSGITVDAHFTPDNWQTVYKQPAFYYQDFEYEVRDETDWIYPTNDFSWKVRFSPNQTGVWQFKLVAQDVGGTYETELFTFTVAPSANKGFIKVSKKDPRYFQYDDGTYFPGLGYNLRIPADENSFQTMSENGIQIIRTWLPSQLPIFGSAWSSWLSFGGAPLPSEPSARLGHDAGPPFNLSPGVDPPIARPESEVFLWLSYDETVSSDGNQWNFVPCVVWGWLTPQLPVKRDTNYRIRVRYKEQDLTGLKVADRPSGFVVKTGGWLWDESDESRRCYYPNTGTLLAATYSATGNWSYYPDPENQGWQILAGNFNSGDTDFLDDLYLAIENVSSGYVFVDYVWLEEDLGHGQYGPNVIHKPWMAHHQYFDQRNSYAFDKTLDLAEQYNIYLKLVILEKNDWIFNRIDYEGNLIPDDHRCWDEDQDNAPEKCPGNQWFYGNWRQMTRVRWLQQAWWRYLQARWGYSPNIHSWELLNEGDPWHGLHYTLADEFGQYMHQFTPNDHLVTTSFWHSFPGDEFWANPDYPNLDYADLHAYAASSTDTAINSQEHSEKYGAIQPEGANKPLIRGETGFSDEVLQDKQGVWLHNYIWAGINPGGMHELYWYGQEHIVQAEQGNDLRYHYKTFKNFVDGIPLNNGDYQDAQATISGDGLRAWGQKDLAHSCAHLWIQNKNHTWKNIVDGISIPSISGTVAVSGFQPGESYTIEWWDTYQTDRTRQIMQTETFVAQPDGSILIPVDNLATDAALKISTDNGCL